MPDLMEELIARLNRLEARVRAMDTREYTSGGGGSGTDADAIHDNVSGEIAAVIQKATPAANDLALIEDSAASNAKKRVTLSSILSALASSISHNGLGSLNTSSYYHLTQTEYTDLTDGGATTLHTHSAVGNHASQHGYLEADEVGIKDIFLARVYPFIKVFDNLDGWTTGHTGSGAFTTGWPVAAANTGATNNSKVIVYGGGIYVYTTSSTYYTRFRIRVHSTTATINENFNCRLGLLTNPTAPTDDEKHIAFRISAGNIYAGCGDGSDATVEDTGVDFSQYSNVHLYFKQSGSTVYFYVNDVLTNTIATNVPTGALIYPTIYMYNSAAVAKALNIYPMMLVQGA